MRKEIGISECYTETLEHLQGNGILLLAGDPPNPMTIGWATIGNLWSKLVFIVLVRPTRFTFGLMEKNQEFSVNILSSEFNKEIAVCGTESGRDVNKIEKCGFTLEKGIKISKPFISQSELHYECRIIHKHRLDAEFLSPKIIDRYYPARDFHMEYYGEIMGIFRNL